MGTPGIHTLPPPLDGKVRKGISARYSPPPAPSSGPGGRSGPTHWVHPDMDPPGLTPVTRNSSLSSAPSLGRTHVHGHLDIDLAGRAEEQG